MLFDAYIGKVVYSFAKIRLVVSTFSWSRVLGNNPKASLPTFGQNWLFPSNLDAAMVTFAGAPPVFDEIYRFYQRRINICRTNQLKVRQCKILFSYF